MRVCVCVHVRACVRVCVCVMCVCVCVCVCAHCLPRNLFLYCLMVGLREQRDESTAKEVSVAVWIAELVCDGIKEEVPSLGVQIDHQVLKDVHVCSV